jgi:hypothetical protein
LGLEFIEHGTLVRNTIPEIFAAVGNIRNRGGSVLLRFGISCLITGNLSSKQWVELKFPVIQQDIIGVKSYNNFKFRSALHVMCRVVILCAYDVPASY